MNLQTSTPATKAQIMARITALEMHFPKSAMTDGERRVWFQQWCEDLKHKTDAEIAYACMRYRQNGANKFMATSGQLIPLCQPAFENKSRRYQPLADLGEPLPEGRAKELIERTRKKYPEAFVEDRSIFDEDRKPLEMTTEMIEREKSLATERQETLQRRLEDRHG